jgi:hypothetical protein
MARDVGLGRVKSTATKARRPHVSESQVGQGTGRFQLVQLRLPLLICIACAKLQPREECRPLPKIYVHYPGLFERRALRVVNLQVTEETGLGFDLRAIAHDYNLHIGGIEVLASGS